MNLPAAFQERMEMLLGAEDFQCFLNSYTRPRFRGLRLNPLKATKELLEKNLPFPLTPAPFSKDSFYIPPTARPGRLAAHHAGMFYAQEPSAASVVTVLAPQPGERILDLCAAPGGKSTQIAAALSGSGLLWANELVYPRGEILRWNLERMGVRNALVSSLHPQKLCSRLTGYFDRVLVDAPCSGEGMFRKEPAALQGWSAEAVKACGERQAAILDSAALAVKPGGILVYATCTFSPEENEETINRFLERHSAFEPLPVSVNFGRRSLPLGVGWSKSGGYTTDSRKKEMDSPGNTGDIHRSPADMQASHGRRPNEDRQTGDSPAGALPIFGRRIFPMDGGEGHFVAKLRRRTDVPWEAGKHCESGISSRKKAGSRSGKRIDLPKALLDQAMALYRQLFLEDCSESILLRGNRLLLLPDTLPELQGIPLLSLGVPLGEVKKNRIEPSHGLFMSRSGTDCRQQLSFSGEDSALYAFLRGEEINCGETGYTAVTLDGVTVGFGKASGGRLKNRYPKGLRIQGEGTFPL